MINRIFLNKASKIYCVFLDYMIHFQQLSKLNKTSIIIVTAYFMVLLAYLHCTMFFFKITVKFTEKKTNEKL